VIALFATTCQPSRSRVPPPESVVRIKRDVRGEPALRIDAHTSFCR